MSPKHWIPVLFGVPEHDKEVLTWSSLDGFVIGSIHAVHNGTEEWRDELGDEYEPSHWQPLPGEPSGSTCPEESMVIPKTKLLAWVKKLSATNYAPGVKVYNELRHLLRMHGTGRPLE